MGNKKKTDKKKKKKKIKKTYVRNGIKFIER